MSAQRLPGEPTERSPLVDALAQALNQRLIAAHGSTMSMDDIAAELGISVGALRIRQSRFGDLPPPIPHLRSHRWPTPRIATWLCALGEGPAPSDCSQASLTRPISRRGRRRLFAQPRDRRLDHQSTHGREA